MIRTVVISNYISVQGLYEGRDENGKIFVSVGSRIYSGKPV